ncbi:hypothetical protein BDF14DRAFT_1777687 [Spinellus fusiger]|nr:hypothetical protein BDF14DRAFT_1777687 [Spinellus fusiger]
MIAPVSGAISIMGAVLASHTTDIPTTLHFFPVYSPKTHSLMIITPTNEQVDTEFSGHEVAIDSLGTFLQPMEEHFANFQSIVLIKEMVTGFEDFDEAYPGYKNIFELRRAKELHPINSLQGFYPILHATPGIRAMKIPLSWERKVEDMLKIMKNDHRPCVSVVHGEKNVGKSSLTRYITNRLLTTYQQVAYIETDVGQTGFTPPGLVSLHLLSLPILGPPFTQQNIPATRSFFIGSASVDKDPGYYLECIRELVAAWRHACQERITETTQPLPLVINTHGWIKGLGHDLFHSIIKITQPTDIYTFSSHPNHQDTPPPSLVINYEAEVQPRVHTVKGDNVKGTWLDRYDASTLRTLALVSYFHQTLSVLPHTRWNFETRLVERMPWTLDWRHLKGVWVLFEQVALRQMLYSLNGSIVGLIGDVVDHKPVKAHPRQEDEIASEDTKDINPPKYFDAYHYSPPPPAKTMCHGLAIIRAIDPSKHQFMLLTPLPLETLELVSGIVKGDLELPIQCILDRPANKQGVCGVPWSKVPYITVRAKMGAGGDALRVRRNLLRRSQL